MVFSPLFTAFFLLTPFLGRTKTWKILSPIHTANTAFFFDTDLFRKDSRKHFFGKMCLEENADNAENTAVPMPGLVWRCEVAPRRRKKKMEEN